MEDFQNGVIRKFAKADISSTGQFSFTEAFSPPNNKMMPLTQGPATPRECSINLTASDNNARGNSARCFIVKGNTDEIVGEAGLGYDQTNSAQIAVGNFYVEFIYADRSVNVQGTVDCSSVVDSRYDADITTINLSLSEGWNSASRVITAIEGSMVSAEMYAGIQPFARWYWRFND